jgi:Cdc6-like AAA superfamily ATPase
MVPSTTLSLAVYNPESNTVMTQTLPSPVNLESTRDAQRRRFWDLLCGPTTPLLMLASSVVVFAAREWQRRSELEREDRLREQKNRREQRERKQTMLAEVEALARFRSQPQEALNKYWNLIDRTETKLKWKDPDVVRRLEEVFHDTVTTDELVKLTGKWFSDQRDNEALRCAQLALTLSPGEDEIIIAFIRIFEYLTKERKPLVDEDAKMVAQSLDQISGICKEKGKSRVSRLLKELGERQNWDRKILRSFGISEEDLRWLDLWPTTSPAEPQYVVEWLSMAGLAFNPFRPESAELDPQLKDYYRRGELFKHVGGRRPTLILGEAGSGKTAAALLLAHDCENPPSRPREQGAFPVYCTLPIKATPDPSPYSYLPTIIQATARYVARYLAHCPEDFLKLSDSRKHGIAHLLSLWAKSPDLLEARVRHSAPSWGTSNLLVRELVAIHQAISYEQEVACDEKLASIPSLLIDALPRRFECMYLILDLSTMSDAPHIVAKHLRHLLDLMIPMAAREVYLKFFMPVALRPYLCNLSTCEVVTLKWNSDDLKEMINNRVSAASLRESSLTTLCGPDVPREPSIEQRLARAADGSPRRLLHLGNELIVTHVQRVSHDPLLSVEDIANVLE